MRTIDWRHHAYPRCANFCRAAIFGFTLSLTACSGGSSSSGEGAGADAGAGAAQAYPPAPAFDTVFNPVNCAELTGDQIGTDNTSDVECGLVSVPVDWTTPRGATLDLAVYRIPASTNMPAADPLVYLADGPGMAGAPQVLVLASGDAAFLRERSDVYVIDQRGTGYSSPALYCREISAAVSEGRTAADGHRECRDRLLGQGIDLANFNSHNNALDINAVRGALGIDSWNLYGTGYGATLALSIMRDVADGVRSVVLDSAIPPQVNVLSEAPFTGYRALEQISSNCMADADCQSLPGTILEQIEVGIARLSDAPISSFGARQYVELLGSRIANPQLAELIQLVAAGGDLEIGILVQEISGEGNNINQPAHIAPTVLLPFITDAAGMSYAVTCAEEFPYRNRTASPPITTQFRASTRAVVDQLPAEFDQELCNVWAVPAAPVIESVAINSEIPTLLLSGDGSYRSPPDWSMLAAESLSMSQEILVAGQAREVLGANVCINTLTRQFLDLPVTDVDTSCVLDLPPVNYVTPTVQTP